MLVTECAAFFFTPKIGCAHLILHDVKLNFEEDLLDIKELNIKSKTEHYAFLMSRWTPWHQDQKSIRFFEIRKFQFSSKIQNIFSFKFEFFQDSNCMIVYDNLTGKGVGR